MRRFSLIILMSIILVGIIAFFQDAKKEETLEKWQIKHQFVLAHAHTLLGFDLVDPEQAPATIRESVMRGYTLIMNTPFYAPKYAKDQLSCTNCHFCGGDTLGGRNNGISLVGVTSIYPQYSERSKKTIDLAQRINNCFERSMSGHPLPTDSQEMKDILAYLNWISVEVKTVKDPPWLGLKHLKAVHQADSEQGSILYDMYCADCHKDTGSGGGELPDPQGKTIPPLWGPNSFNDGAGMSMPDTLASFIYWNMPYQNSVLSEEQAMDVAAFILEKPRPHFE